MRVVSSKKIYKVWFVGLMIVSLVFSAVPAQAFPDVYSEHETQFIDPTACDPTGQYSTNPAETNSSDSPSFQDPSAPANQEVAACVCSDSASSGGGSIDGNENAEIAFKFFVSQGYTKNQSAGIVGNLLVESGLEPQRKQGTPSGTKTPADSFSGSSGWGIAQWTAGGKFINPVKASGKDPNDLMVQLQVIADGLKGEAPLPEGLAGQQLKTTTTIAQAAEAFQGSVNGNPYFGYERPASRTATINERISKGEATHTKYADSVTETQPPPTDTSTAPVADNGGCSLESDAGGGAVAGDLTATVKGYAWPKYHSAPYTNARKAYMDAVQQARAAGQYVGGIVYPGIDCGGYITRVMIDSGYESNYNSKGRGGATGSTAETGSQWWWLNENWDKVAVNSTADLKPGDVAMRVNHTYMYVGNISGWSGPDKEFSSASLDSRAPMAGQGNPLASDISWYRKKQVGGSPDAVIN